MLDERKVAILRAVVEEYVSTAQPVGSSHIARSRAISVSPATVRNDMAYLEQEGYLAQPHTSAGRIPSRPSRPIPPPDVGPGIRQRLPDPRFFNGPQP